MARGDEVALKMAGYSLPLQMLTLDPEISHVRFI